MGDGSPAALTELLPKEDEEIFRNLELFQQRGQSCSFPHVLDEATKKEVERFLEEKRINATKAPDMLALLFATLAVGVQIGIFYRNDRQWHGAPMEEAHGASDCYRKILNDYCFNPLQLTVLQLVRVCKHFVMRRS